LVVMTPKGLLRLPAASARLEELSEGSFQPVLAEPGVDSEAVRRLVLCSGKVYYDLTGHELRAAATSVSVGRIEQLYPFPTKALAELVGSFPHLEELVWAQEEPPNMGAYRSIRH